MRTDWTTTHLPGLTGKVLALANPPFAWTEVTDLIGGTVKAAQDLKGRLAGKDRKTVVKVGVRHLGTEYARPRLGLFNLPLEHYSCSRLNRLKEEYPNFILFGQRFN
ncbi:hypothetical protein [Deinococcus hopiensis]|uniref:Uncharacterized protein n=1 Tax=Deinococcus hopiensis KR-140 TaxID=695939 RepID=A0A1W1VB17_9DEIO|nr:hypothetical protein [Deinococcus hopiensis]SMB90609.1 hypothetical protein SAMN00790413_00830 [Deinococcus hopiensis KR-140]